MTNTTQVAWPEGVAGRFLNLGGATVDIRLGEYRAFATAACTGALCNATHEPHDYTGYYLDSEYSHEEAEEKALESAREDAAKWAQAHAEKCRAMPLPGGAR